MSSNIYTAGLHNVGSYQVSGIPYASGSLSARSGTPLSVSFPYVTRWVTIINNDAANDLKVGFSAFGLAGSNYFTVPRGDSNGSQTAHLPRLELKITSLFFTGSSDFDVVAGLSSIPTVRIDNLSGSGGNITGPNWSGSSGVG
jgi:hypothetical protein